MLRKSLVTVCVLAVLGCAGGDHDDKPRMSGGTTADSRPEVTLESLGGRARITGVVRFEGTPPESREVRVAGDKFCVEQRGDSFVDPDMVLDDQGRVANVFVYLQGGVPEHRFAVPTEPVGIDQSGCQYVPRVLGAQVGQAVRFSNSDATLHNVHSVVDKKYGNKAFNFGMPGRKGVTIDKVFTSSEIMARIKCDVHPWMVAWVGVLPHPWFAVTDDSGTFHIDQVPDGHYVLAAWHERLGETTVTIDVRDGSIEPVDIVFPQPASSSP